MFLRAHSSSLLRKEPNVTCFPPSFCYGITEAQWHYLHFNTKFLIGGCKKGVLMQYKCMEKEIRKLHGRVLFPSAMYIANIPAGMQL